MTFALPIFLLLGYLVGSIPSGLILTKIFMKKDIREVGSGNIGTTNVLRTGNKPLAAATLFFDAAKGAFLIILLLGINTDEYCESDPSSLFNMMFAFLLGFGAILGHCFPIWLKFKGGKGVATTIGVLLAAVPVAGLTAIVTWLLVAITTRYSSLSALTAIFFAPIVTFIAYGLVPAIFCGFITILVWIRHIENIKRLLNGSETKIGQKKKDASE